MSISSERERVRENKRFSNPRKGDIVLKKLYYYSHVPRKLLLESFPCDRLRSDES